MKNIDAKEYTLKQLLSNQKFTVDYFQREYKWDSENMEQLIQDLVNGFNDDWKPGHTPEDVATYNTYYMGSIVLCQKGGTYSIIDGQQRITSLTLLLIYLNHLTDGSFVTEIGSMVYSNSYGKRSYNLNVPEREKCLDSLFKTGTYIANDDDDESTKTMAERYDQLNDSFPNDIQGDMLQCFVWWVMEKIVLVRILSSTEENAYTIFETMNNRGKPLTKSDMLKGFVLSKYRNDDSRAVMNKRWKSDMLNLKEYDDDAENQFFQAWLRAQYAETIRQSKENSINQDFENIGSRYHNWFKDNFSKGLLAKAIDGDIERFTDGTYKFYLKNFILIKNAENEFCRPLEHIFYNRYWGISPSLSYPLFLAPLNLTDDENTCMAKMNLVAKYLDCFVTRRAANYKQFSASSIRYTMCTLTKTIRGKNLSDLRDILVENLAPVDEEYNFSALTRFGLTKMNGRFIKFFLARITSYIEEKCQKGERFSFYMKNPGCKPFEIEHIWSDHFEQHKDEFEQMDDFATTRNLIGDLVLLPKSSNASYNDMEVEKKLPHYLKENMLAASLAKDFYINNPSFIQFCKKNNFPFKPYSTIKKDNIRERCELYSILANVIWSKDLI